MYYIFSSSIRDTKNNNIVYVMIFTTNKRFAKKTDPVVQYVESPVSTFSHRYRSFVMHKSQNELTKPETREKTA